MSNIYTDITKFVFISDKPEKSDIIFITGGSFPQQSERAAQLYNDGFARLILPSGKYSVHRGCFDGAFSKKELYSFSAKTEWEFMQRVLVQNGVKATDILKEDEAVSTYDNARFSRIVTDKAGMEIKKAIVCCKSIHARRAYMYYQYYYPNANILICPVDIQGITAKNWHTTPLGIQIVMQEVQKCGTQFADMLCTQSFGENYEKPDLLSLF